MSVVERQAFSIPEVARILGMSTDYVRRELIGRNRIRHVRLGRKMIRISAAAVEEFLASDSGRSTPTAGGRAA